MTYKEKQRIIELRNSGLGYGAIAMELGLSKNVVSSFCHRYNIEFNKPQDNFCKNCGNKLDNPVSLNLITCYFFACCEIAYAFFQPSLNN